MAKIVRHLSKLPFRSFQYRLLIYLLIYGSLTLVCFIGVSFFQSSRFAQAELESYINKAHDQTLLKIEKEMTRFTYLSKSVTSDYIVQQYMKNPRTLYNTMSENEVKQYMDHLLLISKESSEYITDLCLTFDDNNTSFCPTTQVLEQIFGFPEMTYQSTLEPYHMNEVQPYSIRYIAPLTITGSLEVRGHLVIIYDLTKLLSDNAAINPVDFHAILDDKGNLIYSSNANQSPHLIHSPSSSEKFTENHADYMANQRKLSFFNVNWISIVEVKSTFLMSSWQSLQNALLYFFSVFFIISVLSSILFAKFITSPLNILRSLMKKAELGDLKAYWTSKSTQEINDLGESFNQMLNRIEDLIKQVKIEEALKKEAEIEALQYQLNPHFLYNTLNTIKWVAKIHKTPQISEVVSSLVRLLQVSLGKKGGFLTLHDEIMLIKDYMEIQSFRYGEQVQVIYDIETLAEVCLVPRMILQPLVENALIHGIEPSKRAGIITIKAWIDRDLLFCQVEDNGNGISESTKEHENLINNGLQEKLSGIGLKHIREKIKLYYGPDYQLRIIPKEQQGTTIRISLPIHTSEE